MDRECRAAFEKMVAVLNNEQSFGCRGAWGEDNDGLTYVWSRLAKPIMFFEARVIPRSGVVRMDFRPSFAFLPEQMNDALRALNWINASLTVGHWMIDPMEGVPHFVVSAPWSGEGPDEEMVRTMYSVVMSVAFEYAQDLFAMRKNEKCVDDILMRVEGVFLENRTLE